LVNWTVQGVRNMKEPPKRAEAGRKLAEKFGGKLQVYYTMGEYDGVYIAEMPSEAMAQYIFALAGLGNVRTKTLKAWTEAEAANAIIGHLYSVIILKQIVPTL
jgi:uncharacterized protein with GYD domain